MLRIYSVSLDLVRSVSPLINTISSQDPDLAKQLRRSIASVPLNIAEGSHARGARRASHYSIAMGSAREALACLETASAFGYAVDVPASVHDQFRAVLGTLYRVLRSPR